jgi:uncharacterized protein (DUF934 family)
MALLTEAGPIADQWQRVAEDDALPTTGRLLLSLERFAAEPAAPAGRNEALGVEIANTTKIGALAAHLDRLDLIAIAFPAFNDGRGFSLARQLRLRGFQGRLRAVGPLIADQVRHALGVGFDEIELPDALAQRQPPEQWRRMREVVSLGYQLGYGSGDTILDRRRTARIAREAAE